MKAPEALALQRRQYMTVSAVSPAIVSPEPFRIAVAVNNVYKSFIKHVTYLTNFSHPLPLLKLIANEISIV